MKKSLINKLILLSFSFILIACDKRIQIVDIKPTEPTAPASAPAVVTTTTQPTINPNSNTPIPDVGAVEFVTVTSTGSAKTMGGAVLESLQLAIQQVNPTRVSALTASRQLSMYVEANIEVESKKGKDHATAKGTLESDAFAKQIVSFSEGSIGSFKVISTTEPTSKKPNFSVTIEAQVAKFKAPASAGLIKVVVAPIKSNQTHFVIGGSRIAAKEVLESIHQELVNSLTQTGRFTVLNRDYDDAINQELDMIAYGETVGTDFAKLGQALSADLILAVTINDFNYQKNVRKLRASDRELVSYSGGWKASQRLINLATRQIMQSSSMSGTAPSTAPTTMGTSVNKSAISLNMQTAMTDKITQDILLRTFPIAIAERDGNQVILSQGGKSVQNNARYQIVHLGKAIIDPQTGKSLGSAESICCVVVINRVTSNLSYGTLENVQISLDNVPLGNLQIRDKLTNKVAIQKETDKASNITPAKKRAAQSTNGDAAPAKTENSKPDNKDDW